MAPSGPFLESFLVSRGAANKAATTYSQYYDKSDISLSSSFSVPLNKCMNNVNSLQYPRGRVCVNKDQICQRTLTEEQNRAIVARRTCAYKLTAPHFDKYLQFSQSPMQLSSDQQDQNSKLFLDKATLIGYA